MKTMLALLMSSIALAGCGLTNDVSSLANASNGKSIWVWAQFNVPIKKSEFETYYYYGRIPKGLFNKISNNEIDSGFILLKDVRYWGNDDLVHAFKDRQNTGGVLFRIEDLRRLELIANEPIVGRGNEQYEDASPASSGTSSSSSSAVKK